MSNDKKYHLDDVPKKDVFKAPNDYFESLQQRIDQRIVAQKPEAKILGMRTDQLKYAVLAIAASIALLIVFLPVRQNNQTSPTAAELIASISDEEALAFLKLSDVEAEDLLDLSEPELWNEVMNDSVPDATEGLDDRSADFLYEQYGITPDENMEVL